MRLLTTRGAKPQRRAPGPVQRAAYPHRFAPRHCAGTSCFHDHPGEVLPVVLLRPVAS